MLAKPNEYIGVLILDITPAIVPGQHLYFFLFVQNDFRFLVGIAACGCGICKIFYAGVAGGLE